MSLLQNSNAIESGGYPIQNSLRFQSASSQYLSRTPASAGNRKTFTLSAWFKRGTLGARQQIFCQGNQTTTYPSTIVEFVGTDKLSVVGYTGSFPFQLETTAVYRDPSAWYHIVVAFDTTQATSTDRIKVYVNGNQVTSFSTASYPTLNYDTGANATVAANLGRDTSGALYLDGYLAEVNFIDGQALTPSSFGETNTLTGQWVAKKYTGTYGTNGFYLPFSNGTSTTTLGYDSSGNGNNWTLTNFTRSAGVSDCWMYDVPSGNGGASGTQPSSNYCVLNPLKETAGYGSYARGNLYGAVASADKILFGSMAIPSSGKWYFEFTGNSGSVNTIGVATDSVIQGTGTGFSNQNTRNYGYGTLGSGNVAQVAVDMDNGYIWFGTNNTWVSGNPSAGTSPSFSNLSGFIWYPAFYLNTSNGNANFGQRSFAYTPPSGFKALCTANLPASTIVKGNKYMDATLYTGNGGSQTVTNAAGFSPDFVWIKSRSSAVSNSLYDIVRGVRATLSSNSTNAENVEAAGVSLTAFNSNGFSLGTDNVGIGSVNANGATYVGWQWDAGSSTVTNTNGSISSQVRANPTAGVSVVTLTTQASGVGTYGHGLGVAPKMIIHKFRNVVGDWSTYHESLGNTKYIFLNTTGVPVTNSIWWNNTSPTSSVVTLGSAFAGSQPIVAYCFAEVPGFSKIDKYTGNASADGPFVYCGFRPKYVLIRNASIANSWPEFDTARNPYNLANSVLFANVADAETSAHATINIDFLSNGFKVRGTNDNVNGSGHTHIFMAFAENPFQNSNAR